MGHTTVLACKTLNGWEIRDDRNAQVAYETSNGWVRVREHPLFKIVTRIVFQDGIDHPDLRTTPKRLAMLINERLANPIDPSEE